MSIQIDSTKNGAFFIARSKTITRRIVTKLKTPIGDVLASMGHDGVLLDAKRHNSVAVLSLDDDLVDYLLECSPSLIAESQKNRREMDAGDFVIHDEVRELL